MTLLEAMRLRAQRFDGDRCTTTIALTEPLLEAAKAKAKSRGKSLSEYVRDLMLGDLQ